jgi:hypothetical protein
MRSESNADYELNLIKEQAQDLTSTLLILLEHFYSMADRGWGYEAEQAAEGIEELIEGVEGIHDQARYYYRSF